MRKTISLLIVLSLLLCGTIVHADDLNSIAMARYDVDDFTDYLLNNNDGKNTKALVDDYFKNQIKDSENLSNKVNIEGIWEIKNYNGKKVKTVKVIKEIKLNDTQRITFYSNGYFGIGEMIKKELPAVELAYSNKWAQYQYDGYNDYGVWIGSALVGQSFNYDGENVGINSEPTGSSSYNSALYTYTDSSIWSTIEVGELETSSIMSFSDITLDPKAGSDEYIISAFVEMYPNGDWYGSGGVLTSN